MTRTAEYDTEAADLVTRTLRAVAVDTPVAEHATPPSGSAPDLHSSVIQVGSRRRRVRTAVAVTAAAAAVLAGILVWSGRDVPGAEGPADVGTTPAAENPHVPPELVPGDLPDGLVAVDDAASTQPSVMYATQAVVLERAGGHVLSAVITWPDGRPAVAAELDRVAQAVGRLAGASSGGALITAPPGEVGGYLTMPLDADVPDVRVLHELLTSQGLSGVEDFAHTTPGWTVREADLGWVPGVAPTTVRSYSDGGDRRLDIYAVAGDLPSAGLVTALLADAHPYPVGGRMGWRVSTCDPTGCPNGPEEVTVWQAAPGTVGAIVADQVTDADVPATIESLPAPKPTPGEHPDWRLRDRSAEGDVPWVVEVGDFVPGIAERPCMSLWVAGQVPIEACSLRQMPSAYTDTFTAVTQLDDEVDDEVTVVFGLFAPGVASVATDAAGAEHAQVEARPIDPDDHFSQRYAVMIVRGGREAPQTFRLLDDQGEVLDTRSLDLNEVGG